MEKHNRYKIRSEKASNGDSVSDKFYIDKKNILVIADRVNGELTLRVCRSLLSKGCKVSVIYEKYTCFKKCIDTENMWKNDNLVQVNCATFEDPLSIKKALNNVREWTNGIHIILNMFSVCEGVDFTVCAPEVWELELKRIFWISFLAAKEFYQDLSDAGEKSGIFSVSNIGGVFGYESVKFSNSSAAVSIGMVKAVGCEIEKIVSKAIDFDDLTDINFVTDKIIYEIENKNKDLEISYIGYERKRLNLIVDNLNTSSKGEERKIGREDVILFIGGGRGILNAAAKAMISKSNATVIIIGRSEIPDESVWNCMSEDEFNKSKEKFIREKKVNSPQVGIRQIIEAYEKIQNGRLLKKNILDLQKLSKKVHYKTCDISDYESVAQLEKWVKHKFGKLTGIVNGAGILSLGILPKRNEELTLKSLLVRGNGVYNIYRMLYKYPLKFIYNFGSIAGRFGIDGQFDYVVSCSLLSKMTAQIYSRNRLIPCFTVDWTAWDEIGMASVPEIKQIQKVRGLRYISVKDGTKEFLKEIELGGNEKEVVIYE